MKDIKATRPGRRRMEFAQLGGTAKRNGHLTVVRTRRDRLKSFSRFVQAAFTSAVVNRPRKTPNSKAFLTSSACNEVHAKGAFNPDK